MRTTKMMKSKISINHLQELIIQNHDIAVPDPPTDTVTSLYFSQKSNSTDFIVTTWDKQVRHYRTLNDIIQEDDDDESKKSVMTDQPSIQSKDISIDIPQLIGTQCHDKPVLDACWNGNDANKIYTVGCDRVIRVWDLEKMHSRDGF